MAVTDQTPVTISEHPTDSPTMATTTGGLESVSSDRSSSWAHLDPTEDLLAKGEANIVQPEPLRTPMQLLEPLLPQADNAARQLNIMEETSTSAFVHAGCHLYEAALLATTACNRIMLRWTDLEPADAAIAARKALAHHRTNFSLRPGKRREFDEECGLTEEALMLQTMLMLSLMKVTIAGTMAGMVIDTRTAVASHKLWLPLTAFVPCNTPNGSIDGVATKFAAFTGGATTSTDIESLIQSISSMHTLLKGVDFARDYSSVFGTIDWFTGQIYQADKHFKDKQTNLRWKRKELIQIKAKLRGDTTEAEPGFSAEPPIKTGSYRDIMSTLQQALEDIHAAAKTTDHLVDLAVAKTETPFKPIRVLYNLADRTTTQIFGWLRGWLGGRATEEPTNAAETKREPKDEDYLKRAKTACQKAITAVGEAKRTADFVTTEIDCRKQ